MKTIEMSTAEHRLARAVARRCRGRTAVLGRRWPEVLHEMIAREVDVQAAEPVALESDDLFDTVVLLKNLEYLPEEDHPSLLEKAWQHLDRDGRLIVCVPNEDLGRDPEASARFTRSSLKRLLQYIDRPHLMKDVRRNIARVKTVINEKRQAGEA